MIKWSSPECVISITLILFLTVCSASGGINTSSLNYKNNLLSVNIQNQQLDDVLGQVTKATGVKFMFTKQKFEDSIQIEFKSLPVEKAIQRILNRFNYALIYTPAGKVSKVLIIGKRNGSPSTNTQSTVKSSPPSSSGSNKQPKTADVKNVNAPDGMAIKNYSGKKYDNKVADGMTITKQPKVPDAANVVRYGTPAGKQSDEPSLSNLTNRVVIENQPKKPEKDSDFPGGMTVTKPINATDGKKTPEGMTISPPPKTATKTSS